MYKYIKRVTYPWVEIESEYDGENNIINIEHIVAICPATLRNTGGVLLSSGEWLDSFGEDADRELREFLMSKDPKSL